MILQIKFGCNRPAGLGDIHVWKCGRTHGRTDARTDARTPARVPSYKLTLWAFGSGELKTNSWTPVGQATEKKVCRTHNRGWEMYLFKTANLSLHWILMGKVNIGIYCFLIAEIWHKFYSKISRSRLTGIYSWRVTNFFVWTQSVSWSYSNLILKSLDHKVRKG